MGGLIVVLSIGIFIKKTTKPIPPHPPQSRETVDPPDPIPEAPAKTTPKAVVNSTTYRNNYGTNIMGGQTGSFRKSSFTWTISKSGSGFNIKTNALPESFNVVYSHYDSPNRLYHYKPSGNAYFDNAKVQVVMCNGKLGDYAAGNLASGNIFSIVFIDNTGYIYKLGK